MATDLRTVDLEIEGMSCAACAARIERKLNGLAGVEATVNLATDAARVRYDPDASSVEQLLAAVEGVGYGARLPVAEPAAAPAPRPPWRTLAALGLSLPVLALSMVPALRFDGWEWVALGLATPVVLVCGWPFHRAAVRGLRHRAATMDTLVSLGTLAAYGWSLAALLLDDGDVYLDVACVITALILTGRTLEHRARRRAGAALRALLDAAPAEVAVLEDGRERPLAAAALRVGMAFVVRPGERIAADGVVERGTSSLDRSVLTGESLPVDVAPGDEVAGGVLNGGGRLVVRATRVGADTAVARIARLVAEAQGGKAAAQRLADRVAAVFVPAVLAIALTTAIGWLLAGGSAGEAMTAAVAVLVIACPCALGLATPTALLVGSGRGAQLGILIRGPEALESARRIDTVVLDKTGTVTSGRMQLLEVTTEGADRATVLRLAGAAERASEHPIGRAVAGAAERELGPLPEVERFAGRAGLGVDAEVDGRHVLVGRPALLAEHGIALTASLEGAAERAAGDGRTAVAVALDGAAAAVLAVGDDLRPESREAVDGLRRQGLRPVLLTGDGRATAEAVGRALEIETVIAEALPGDKEALVRGLQAEGHAVAMVGDGVNDAPALARADLGVAVGSGTDVAAEAADITLVSADLRGVVDAVRLARRTLATIRWNLFWAFAYNVAAIPLAAAGKLSPIVAAAAMACSSVFVVSNSLRLRRFTPSR
jgi:Cu+-exporting ATPase